MVHRDDLGDHRDVLAGIERDGDARDLDAEDRRRLGLEAGPLDRHPFLPLLQHDHDLDALLLAHGADAEERLHVDQADPADFHVMAREFVAAADQDVGSPPRHLHHVVRHEPVPPLHEVEHAFALADARAPDEEEADAIDVGQRSVQCGPRREGFLHQRLDAAIELGGLEPRAQHRYRALAGHLQQFGGHLESLGHEEAGEVEGEEAFEPLPALGVRHRLQVGDFRLTQDVEALRRKPARVAGKRKSRTRHFGIRDLPVEAYLAGEHLQLERVILPLQEVT